MYEYKCIIDRIIDGDTVDVHISLGFDVWLNSQRIRLSGVDTPETRTSDKIEEHFGEISKSFVEQILLVGSVQHLVSKEFNPKGSYGRILGDFRVYDGNVDKWTTLSDVLTRYGYAATYRTGEEKPLMEQEHLNNRKKMIDEGHSTMTYQEAGVEEV